VKLPRFALAIKKRIGDLLIDEAAGRRVGVALGLKVSGLLGVMLEAKQRGHLAIVSPLLDRLHADARFYISEELRKSIVKSAQEL
jgi:predicted nucleic acid-binding protein